MKKLTLLILFISSGVLFFGCKKDNLDGPDATFYGKLIDKKTGEPLQQEISDGSRLYFMEMGWDNPPIQNMVIKSDGSFKNSMMFSGNYKFILNRGNYVALDTMDIELKKGENYKDFEVTPYIRVIDPEIVKSGRSIIATFRLDQVTSNRVYRVSLFVHSHIDVSNRLNIINNTININRTVDNGEVFTLKIDLDAYTTTLLEGKSYYFRIGAQAQGSEAKYNYAPSLQIKI